MDEQTARIILYGITAAGIAVWFAGLRFVNVSCRVRRAAREAAHERFRLPERPPENLVFGSTELPGEPATLMAKATSLLVKEDTGALGQLKILERTEDRVTFEGVGLDSSAQGAPQCVRHGQIQFTELRDGSTCVDYAVEVSRGRGLLLGAAISLILGAAALVAGFLLLNTYVVSHQDSNVRGQVFQMFQAGHFLWPPFLFGTLYRRRYTTVEARLDTLIHNLPYYDG